MNIKFFDDKKEKYQSIECYIGDISEYPNIDLGVYDWDICELTGYGETKQEAFEDFKVKFKFLMDEYRKLEKKVDEMKIKETKEN